MNHASFLSCASKKVCYSTEVDVKDALIYHRAKYPEKSIQGPRNYYFCIECGNYHLTSTGNWASFLLDSEVLKKINREREKQFWEHRTK